MSSLRLAYLRKTPLAMLKAYAEAGPSSRHVSKMLTKTRLESR